MFLNFRYITRFILAFLDRFKTILILGSFLGILSFFVIRFGIPIFFGHRVERIGITGRFTTDLIPTSILSLVSGGLTKIGEGGEPEPQIASSWESTDQGKTWTFHLKEGLLWQDSKRLTSSDVTYDFSDLSVVRPDSKTITFKLQNSYSPFPSVVSKPVFRKGLLGIGEWKVAKISIAGNFVQELDLTNKKVDKKTYKFYPTEERARLAYKLGEVDTLVNLFDPRPFDSWKTVHLERDVDSQKVVLIFLNTQDKLLSEKNVRLALAYAIQKGQDDRAISPIGPSSWGYNPQVKPYNYDEGHAKQLVVSLAPEQKKNLNIKLTTSPLLLKDAENIVKDWERVGFKATVQVTSGAPTDYQAFLTILDIPSDPDQYSLWHSTQGSTNISRYQNPRIDKLLEDGRTTFDLTERKRIYLDFQRFLLEDSPAIFLYHPTTYTISRKLNL